MTDKKYHFMPTEESDALIAGMVRVANNSVYGKFHTQPKECECPWCKWKREKVNKNG